MQKAVVCGKATSFVETMARGTEAEKAAMK